MEGNTENINKYFGVVLKELREKKGLSQQELADYSNIQRSYISRLERGEHKPSLHSIFKISEVLKIKPGELVDKVYYYIYKEYKK